jgi:hypothetical protein
MATIEIIDYEDYITMEEGEIIYISISDWDIPPGISTDYFTQAGSLIVSTAAATPFELEAPVAADLVLTSNPALPEKIEWKAAGGSGGDISLTNKSGSDQVAGTVVIWETDYDTAFKLTTVLRDRRVAGVLAEDIANNATGKVAVGAKKATVKVQGNVSRGMWLIASTTSGRAQADGYTRPNGAIGMALTEYTGGSTGTVTALIVVDVYLGASASKSYILGGSNATPAAVTTTQMLTLASETVSIVAGAALGAVRTSCVGCYTTDKGITYGGTNTTLATGGQVTAYKTTFASDVTAASVSANLVAAKTAPGPISAPLAAYICGGVDTASANTATAYKTPWATETTAAQASANLSSSRGYMGGMVHSTTNGYLAGGASVATTDRLVIATETTAALASGNLTANREGAIGTKNTTQGYWSGGLNNSITITNTTDKMPFSTETTAAVGGAALTSSRKKAAGANGLSGYILGGSTSTTNTDPAPTSPAATTDKINFSSDTTAAASGANLVTSLSAMASMTAE